MTQESWLQRQMTDLWPIAEEVIWPADQNGDHQFVTNWWSPIRDQVLIRAADESSMSTIAVATQEKGKFLTRRMITTSNSTSLDQFLRQATSLFTTDSWPIGEVDQCSRSQIHDRLQKGWFEKHINDWRGHKRERHVFGLKNDHHKQ